MGAVGDKYLIIAVGCFRAEMMVAVTASGPPGMGRIDLERASRRAGGGRASTDGDGRHHHLNNARLSATLFPRTPSTSLLKVVP